MKRNQGVGMKKIISSCLVILCVFITPTVASESILSFDFAQGKLENGFDKWQYVDKGTNPCGVYDGHKLSKLCSSDDAKFYLYYNGYNNNHMGWMRYGYIDADDKISVTGSSLKIMLTGGAYANDEGKVAYLGKPIFSKSDFVDENDYGNSPDVNLSAGGTSLYLKSPSSTANFPQLQNKNRLTMWVLWPKTKDSMDYYALSPALRRPNHTASLYPFIDRSNGGHYYHSVSNIPMGGWTKIQFDAHPQHHNAGSNNPNSAFSVGGYEYPGDGIAYFNNTTALAFVTSFQGQKGFPAFVNIDDIGSHLTLYENDETINNLAIGYDQQNKIFDVGLTDKYRCLKCYAKYLIKYSFSPITLANFDNAFIPKEVINFDRSHNNNDGYIVKPNAGYSNLWAALKVQEQHLDNLVDGTKIYFAIKDVSVRSQIKQEAIDSTEQNVPRLGKVRTIDLLKTIDYQIHIVDYPLKITTSQLEEAVAGHAYSSKINYSGGSPPYTLSALTPLPEGISINADGVISGTPKESADLVTEIKLTDERGQETTKTINWTIKSESDFDVENCTGIVDFNETGSGKDIITSIGFDKVIADKYNHNVKYGRTIAIGQAGGYDFQGVSGVIGLDMKSGDSIRSVWYNNSDNVITFTPKISFDDPDRRTSGAVGSWENMTLVQIKPRQWAVSNYVIPDNAVEYIDLINITVNYNHHKTLVLDKIEHVSEQLRPNDICVMPFTGKKKMIHNLSTHNY